ncbi:helix-turn-helix transcriptional regulator [Constantimarinum furrinae]|uniref:DNA-binding protein n=1 Tax=Constantimarinum furrinae TaxID=2562285 RepID=A0A7G8PWF0_9FLAO|nr:helix-turn-helix transcriptional regulator [Constantimarinum furrinae]QNJ98666.1 DNA-binding protein [Constantimarinum furrinae]
MVNSTDFAKRLEKILAFYGLSAAAFSEEIDFNRSTMSHLLSGRNKPSLDFIMKVIQKFPEVELYWLLNGKGSFPAQSKTIQETSSSEHNEPLPKNESKPASRSASASIPVTGNSEKEIDRVIIFYKDGSFKAYEN